MSVGLLNHFTVRCRPQDLAELRDFYVEVLGLAEGARPDFRFPGHWLYSEGQPVVHLAGVLAQRPAADTGPLDHIAFTAHDLPQARLRLAERQIAFDEKPVPGFPLHQVFFNDPQGLRIELTFQVPEAHERAR